MIHHLRGILTEKSPTHAVIDVGGVGYGLSISLNTFDSLAVAGSTVSLHTHTYVREDRLQLFGFSDPAEREMFELLISVSGIGPNSAQTILSGLSVADLQKAIHRDQVNELTKIRGVGTKTAQRVVVELRDKIRLPWRRPTTGKFHLVFPMTLWVRKRRWPWKPLGSLSPLRARRWQRRARSTGQNRHCKI